MQIKLRTYYKDTHSKMRYDNSYAAKENNLTSPINCTNLKLMIPVLLN